jgi:hypothetical protein
MAVKRNWRKLIYEFRENAKKYLSVDNSAALLNCRKSMEVIQLSIFEAINGELPSTYLPFEKMMANKGIGSEIPRPARIDFNTVNEWGNYGCHWQEEEPSDDQVTTALSALDSLIAWCFDDEKIVPEPTKSSKTLDENIKVIKWGNENINITNVNKIFTKKYNVNDLFKYISKIDKTVRDKRQRITRSPNVVSKPKKINQNNEQENQDYETIHLLIRAVELSGSDVNNWVNLAEVGIRIRTIDPEFKLKSTGHSRLELLFKTHDEVFEMKSKTRNGKKVVFVRIRETTDN